VQATTLEMAQQWCNENMGHLKVIGELVSEIPANRKNYVPDFANEIDYEKISLQ
jgi:hypothetical protein